jgi:protein associated with RNAse G/E
MPLMTLQDRILLIESHLGSIKRAVTLNAMADVSQWFNAIASVASEGESLYSNLEDTKKP